MFCPKCGSENKDGCKFCRKCGQSFSVSQNKQSKNNKGGFIEESGDVTQVNMSPVNIASGERNDYKEQTKVVSPQKNDDLEEENIRSSRRKNNIFIIIGTILAAIAVFAGSYIYFSKPNKPNDSKPTESITQHEDKTSNKVESKNDDSAKSDKSKDDKTMKSKDSKAAKEEKNEESVLTEESSNASSNLYNFKCRDNEYICSALSETYLAEGDFSKLNKHQIQLLINEIYAKHGYKFSDEEWVNYFSNKTWYVGVKSDVKESDFNDFEKSNIEILKNIRSAK